ncbi:hypothetical protein VTJ04DRAFT_5304 [Mycothermus thermophilus]|uniref:uncharacterized protein n=1 Tax=Humicola insolens TaxID=85995 RepID=UPI003743F77E
MVHFHNGHLHLPHLHIYRHLRRFIKHLTRHVEHIILYITALLIPPLAVYLRRGVDKRDFALNIALTLLGWYVNPAGVSYYVLKLRRLSSTTLNRDDADFTTTATSNDINLATRRGTLTLSPQTPRLSMPSSCSSSSNENDNDDELHPLVRAMVDRAMPADTALVRRRDGSMTLMRVIGGSHRREEDERGRELVAVSSSPLLSPTTTRRRNTNTRRMKLREMSPRPKVD